MAVDALEFRSIHSHLPTRGSNLEDVRRRNLSTVLGLVHAHRRLSRADLARETGLNRSTVAAIVAELERRSLIVESEPQGVRRAGRPSFVITPTETTVAIAVNPELDAITIGVVSLGGNVQRVVRFKNERVPTAREVANAVSAVLAGMAPQLADGYRTVGVGLAVPGLVRTRDGVVNVAPHLDWHDEPLAQLVTEATGYEAWVANDAGCGVVAESLFGAGRDHENIVYLNGGASGIGGGVIIDGARMGGAGGFAGELGHTLVNSAGTRCHCGASGCLETEVRRAELLEVVGLDDTGIEELEQRLVERYPSDADRARGRRTPARVPGNRPPQYRQRLQPESRRARRIPRVVAPRRRRRTRRRRPTHGAARLALRRVDRARGAGSREPADRRCGARVRRAARRPGAGGGSRRRRR